MTVCPACQSDFLPVPGEFPQRCPVCRVLVLGAYCELHWIGGGGMGDVYRAREPRMGDRIVAIKIPRTGVDTDSVQRRFEREIMASARLQHENAVRAYYRGEEAGRPYLVMEFVTGTKLSDVIWRDHPLAARRVARIMLGVARGLAHAERLGVVNRDIKPANIFLVRPDDTPKLIDYGLALIKDRQEEVTRHGSLLGTPNYIAPEQFRDPHSVSVLADVYSLGCTAFCCLTGQPPFAGSSEIDETYRLHSSAERPSARTRRPDVPENLDALVRQMMAVEPHQRPTPRQLIRDLEEILPELSDLAPALPHNAAAPIDVVCPSCQTSYHLSFRSAGSRVRCANRLCGAVITVPRPDDLIEPPAGGANPDDRITELHDAGYFADVPPAMQSAPDADTFDEPPATLGSAMVAAIPDVTVPEAELPPALPVRAEDARLVTPPPPPSNSAADLVRRTGMEFIGAAVPPPAVQAHVTFPEPPPIYVPPRPGHRPKRRGERRKRSHRVRWIGLGVLAALSIATAVLLWLRPPEWLTTADRLWSEMTELVAQHKWANALRKLERFEGDYPDDPRVPQAPFFRDLCEAGPEIYSTTGDAPQGLVLLEELFKRHRDNPAYAGYCADLYQALAFLVENRFVPEAGRTADPQALTHAYRALALAKTVGQSMPDAWVPQRTAELAAAIESVARSVDLALARSAIGAHLDQIPAAPNTAEADAHYAAAQKQWSAFPTLREDRELLGKLEAAYQAEPARVRYLPEDPRAAAEAAGDRAADEPTNGPPEGPLPPQAEQLAIVWGKPSSEAIADQDEVRTALARGVLYAFDGRGQPLWTRRLGIDAARLPLRIARSAATPGALVALSTEEKSVLALEASRQGRILWRYPVQSDLVATLSIAARHTGPNEPPQYCGLLPTANGEIHVLELVLGKRLGRFALGQSLTVGGTYDPATGLVFFPADTKRVFALDPAAIDDPQKPACRSVLFTDHASGAIRAEPTVVGRYLAITEATELEVTRLRVFEIGAQGFARTAAAPLEEFPLRGWAWFHPYATPDQITLVTDQGELGIFGFNLDNPGEAVFPVVRDSPHRATVALKTHDRARTLAVAASEHLVWVMAGGRLHKLSIDVVQQRVKSLWTDSENRGVRGIPAHEAQLDRQGKTFFLTTMEPSGRSYHFTAVDADSGRQRWQCQLGLLPLDGAIPWQDHLVLFDSAGQKLALSMPSASPSAAAPRIVYLPPRDPPPGLADEERALRLGDPPGPVHLVVPVDDASQLAISTLRDPGSEFSPWTVLALPARLHGRPCLSGDLLVVPCIDGQLYRVRLDGTPQATSEVSFTWSRSIPPGPAGAEVYALDGNAVLLIDEGRRIRRLELSTQDQVTRWAEAGRAFHLPSPIQGEPLVVGNEVVLFDAAGMLYRLDARNPVEQRAAPLATGLAITRGPVVRGDHLIAVAEERKIVGIPLSPSPPSKTATANEKPAPRPFWICGPLGGRIRGQPSLSGTTLLVADNGGEVTGVRLADGQVAWKAPLGVRCGPAAAPAPFGPDKMLVPLADGTLLVLPIPQPRLAEAAP